MCCEGKCLFMEVETGALIYAILNFICMSLGSVVSIAMLIYTNIMVKALVEIAHENGNDQESATGLILGFSSNIILSILTVGFLIFLIFALFLLIGICKRNPNYVKVYFIFAVMNMCFGGIILIIIMIQVHLPMISLLILIVYAIKGLQLHMIRLTYLKFQGEAPFQTFSNPRDLGDKC